MQAFEKGVEITQELVIKKVTEIIANRGKRTSNISEQISLLEQVCQKIGTPTFIVQVRLNAKAYLSADCLFYL